MLKIGDIVVLLTFSDKRLRFGATPKRYFGVVLSVNRTLQIATVEKLYEHSGFNKTLPAHFNSLSLATPLEIIRLKNSGWLK